MSKGLAVCELDASVIEKIKKFRFRKETNNAAIILKIDPKTKVIVCEETIEDVTPEEIQDEIPASQPRYIVYSYALNHDDGRKSYPLCLIFISPPGCKTEQQIMYAGSKVKLVKDCEISKVFDIRSLEDFTEEWLIEKLKFFG